ncbi:MAG: hypothetical protein P1U32_07910 [Legionellaceae bacterium]|nr:hypothetical protein [Legionellaceae bacterium]
MNKFSGLFDFPLGFSSSTAEERLERRLENVFDASMESFILEAYPGIAVESKRSADNKSNAFNYFQAQRYIALSAERQAVKEKGPCWGMNSEEFGRLSKQEKVTKYEEYLDYKRTLLEQAITEGGIPNDLNFNDTVDSVWGFVEVAKRHIKTTLRKAISNDTIDTGIAHLRAEKNTYLVMRPLEGEAQDKRAACMDEMIKAYEKEMRDLLDAKLQEKKLKRALKPGFDEIHAKFEHVVSQICFYEKTKTPGQVVYSPTNIMASIKALRKAALGSFRDREGRNALSNCVEITHADFTAALEDSDVKAEPVVRLFFKIGGLFRKALEQPNNKKNLDEFKQEVTLAYDECIAHYKANGNSTAGDYIREGVLMLAGFLVGILTSPGLVFESYRKWMRDTFFSGVDTEEARALRAFKAGPLAESLSKEVERSDLALT